MTSALTVNHHDLVLNGPVGSLDAYVSAVNAVPVLNREEEQELARQFREDDNLDAARRLVMSQLRFVVHIARGYKGYGLPLNDL
ncbi:MAG: RNA polymerase sigma factor RpoH, partial [Gammaproteobacteria bacterium]